MELSWQFALLGFAIWFTWFFIGSRLWIFILSFAIYAATLYLWRKVREYLYWRFAGSRTVRILNRIIFWSIPPLILFALFRRLDNPNLVGTVGLLWTFCIAVYVTAGYLFEKEINIEREGTLCRAPPFVVPVGERHPADRQTPPPVQSTSRRVVRDPYRYVRLVRT